MGGGSGGAAPSGAGPALVWRADVSVALKSKRTNGRSAANVRLEVSPP